MRERKLPNTPPFFGCLFRCIRADKVAKGVQAFVESTLGDRFVKSPVFDLNACFSDSSCVTPLVFILSPGSDPMGAVLKAADSRRVKVGIPPCAESHRSRIA